MKIKFLATATSPEAYNFDDEAVNGFDLSPLQHGDKFFGNDESKAAGIRDAYRDKNGELHVTLTQSTISSKIPGRPAHWRGGEEIDAAEYDAETCYVVPTGLVNMENPPEYVIGKATDVTGQIGWTVMLPPEKED